MRRILIFAAVLVIAEAVAGTAVPTTAVAPVVAERQASIKATAEAAKTALPPNLNSSFWPDALKYLSVPISVLNRRANSNPASVSWPHANGACWVVPIYLPAASHSWMRSDIQQGARIELQCAPFKGDLPLGG